MEPTIFSLLCEAEAAVGAALKAVGQIEVDLTGNSCTENIAPLPETPSIMELAARIRTLTALLVDKLTDIELTIKEKP